MPRQTPSVILITGASSGLGAALAREYARPGMTLALTGRNASRLQQVADSCARLGAAVHITTVDVTDAAAFEVWLMDIDRQHPIDLCIANAGISGGPGVMNGEDPAHVKNIFDVNVYGVFNTVHPLIPKMMARKYGHIAIISSLAGFRGSSTAPAYSTSKAAVRYYAQALHGLLAPFNIKVSTICPGFIRTNMTAANPFPMPFLMDADQAARKVRQALDRRTRFYTFPWPMALFARLQNMLPNALIEAIYRRVPAKLPPE